MTTFLEAKKAKNKASRGKSAESEVRKYLQKMADAEKGFDFERKYDARSAGGRFPSQAGDFGWFWLLGGEARHGLIEVKEVAHDFRLPKTNLTTDSIARLLRRHWAGGDIMVLINFTTTKLWAMARLPVFGPLPPGQGSWDLSMLPRYDSCEQALNTFFTDWIY